MVEADPVMRAARNGFLVLIVALLAVSIHRFFLVEDGGLLIPGLWTLGALVFYASRLYYERQASAE